MRKRIRIGTRESQLAVWQATQVLDGLTQNGFDAELVLIKSEGDLDLATPLYEMGVQGIFTRSLDIALLNDRIDLAVHSMKDVPTQLAAGIVQAAALKRASHKDILVYNIEESNLDTVWQRIREGSSYPDAYGPITIATSSIRRKAQWLYRYPDHKIESLRGNINTRLNKLKENGWNAAIFAAAGLERIGLRPFHSFDLDWMLPAPAQGAIVVQSRENDTYSFEACVGLNDPDTALCTFIEREFLRTLLGGCSTPISALAEIEGDEIIFRGNILAPDGSRKIDIEKILPLSTTNGLGKLAANELLNNGGREITESLIHAAK